MAEESILGPLICRKDAVSGSLAKTEQHTKGRSEDMSGRFSGAGFESLATARRHLGRASASVDKAAQHHGIARGLGEQLQRLRRNGATGAELRGHAALIMHHLDMAGRHLSEAADYHAFTGLSLMPALAAASVAEPGAAPGDAEPGLYEPSTGLYPLSQFDVTEDDVTTASPGRGDAGGPRLLEAAAINRGRADALNQLPVCARPAWPIAVDKAHIAGADAPRAAVEALLAGVDLAAAGRDRDATHAAASRVAGNQIVATITGRHRFGRSVFGTAGERRG